MNAFEKVTEFQNKLIAPVPSEVECLSCSEDGGWKFGPLLNELEAVENELKQFISPQALQSRLMVEELREFMEASHTIGQADALIDLIYICMGGLSRMGLDGQKLFDVVHDANMTKLWEDGKPRFDEQGKLLKPPHFVRPEETIAAEIDRQREYARQDRGY